MATTFILYNSSIYLDLNSSPFGVRLGGGFAAPDATRVFSKPWGRGYSPMVGANYGNKTLTCAITMTGTSIDNWIAHSRQIHQLLTDTEQFWESGGKRGDRAYLSIQLNGATNAIEHDILSGVLEDQQFLNPTLLNLSSAPRLTDIQLILSVKPFGKPQSLSAAISGVMSNASGYTVAASAVVGDREAPVKLTALGVSTPFNRMIVARRTVGNVANFLNRFPMEGEPGTYPGYDVFSNVTGVVGFTVSSGVAAGAHGGLYGKIDKTTAPGAGGAVTQRPVLLWRMNADINDMFGRFAAYIHFANDGSAPNSSEMFSMYLTYGGVVITSTTGRGDIILQSVTSPAGGWGNGTLYYMGIIEVPHRHINPEALLESFDIQLVGDFSSASGRWGIDGLFLLPVDEQFMDIKFSTNIGAFDFVVNDNNAPVPALYITNSSGAIQPEYPLGQSIDSRFTLRPNVDNLFVALGTTQATTRSVLTYTSEMLLAFEFYPHYDFLR